MYETGVSSGVADLINKIKAFSEKNQWTIDKYGNDELYLHNGGNHFILTCDTREASIDQTYSYNPVPHIYIACATGFDPAKTAGDQPGIGKTKTTNGLYSPFVAYHLFGGTDFIHCVVEINTGLFAHIGFGISDKTWAYDGGGYIFYTFWYSSYNISKYIQDRGDPDSSKHGYPFDYSDIIFNGSVMDVYNAYPKKESAFLADWYFRVSPNQMNGVAPLMPIVLTAAGSGDTTKYLLGTPPDIRSVRMDYLQPGAVVRLGNDEWMCFPIKRKALSPVSSEEFSSGTYGIAYKKR